jgi:hypothetical protein
MDTTFSYPARLRWLGEGVSIEPSITIYNIGNFANFGNFGNQQSGVLADVSRDPTSLAGYLNGPNDFSTRDGVRLQRGSGSNDIGGPRTMEFQLKFNF